MSILVTGGTGFIGQVVVKKLVCQGHEVVILSRRGATFPKEIQEKIRIAWGDIREFADVLRIVADFGVKKIIHVAYTLTAEGEANPLSAVQTNVLGTCHLFEAARLQGIGRVIFCSSIAAFSPQEKYGDRPLQDEEDLMKPVSIYGATKVLNEFLSGRFEKRYGIEIPLLRIAAVYGRGREERGVTAWTSQMIAAAVREKPVIIKIPSRQRACFIYVDDVAEQLVRLCLTEKLKGRIYNSGGFTSCPAAFREIILKYYPRADIRFDESSPPWPYPYKIDGTRLAREIQWEIQDPDSGLLHQINEERAALNLPLLKKAG